MFNGEKIHSLISRIKTYEGKGNKEFLTEKLVEEFKLQKPSRGAAVFYCDYFAIRFCSAKGKNDSISNPALKYSLVNDISGSLNDASKLMLYGYNVSEGNLTQFERRSILAWIIDSGFLSKAEIIKDLQFKVRYNGSKTGNEKARKKWQDDIQFVSQYVQGNNKQINAVFINR